MTINLLPPKIKKENALRQKFATIFFGVSAIFLMLIVTAGSFYIYNDYLASDIKKIDDKISSQNKKLKEFKETKEQILQINSRLENIEQAEKEKIYWSKIIETISAATPKGTQIKTLNLNQDKKSIYLSGSAASRKDIALMKEKLESLPLFKNVAFSSSTYNSTADNYTFSFDFELEETAK